MPEVLPDLQNLGLKAAHQAIEIAPQCLLACLAHWILQISAVRGSYSPVFIRGIVTPFYAAATVLWEIRDQNSD